LLRLLERLWSRNGASGETWPSYPRGARMYCIGDIHGRDDLLVDLHAQIEADAADYRGRKQILYLGDYIDRGPQSCQVIERLLNAPLAGFESIHLKGNHEQFLLDFLEFPGAAAGWLTFGGRETLASYGIDVPVMPARSRLAELAGSLADTLPPEHLAFFRDSPVCWRGGDYYFVHAGIRPGVPLDQQHAEDQIWIRDEFLDSTCDHGVVVVHGHTNGEHPEFRSNRIGIDTGACFTGVLTCLVLEDQDQRLLQTGQGS